MDDRGICLPWDKNNVLIPLEQRVVYGELQKIDKNLQENTEILVCRLPPHTDTKKSSMEGGGGVCFTNGMA